MSQPRLIGWRPIAHTSNQVVLYHTPSHALAVRSRAPLLLPLSDETPLERDGHQAVVLSQPDSMELLDGRADMAGQVDTLHSKELCPYCYQTLPPSFNRPQGQSSFEPQHAADTAHEPRSGYQTYRTGDRTAYPRRDRTRGSFGQNEVVTPVVASPRFSALPDLTEGGSANASRPDNLSSGDYYGRGSAYSSSTTSDVGDYDESGGQRITPLSESDQAYFERSQTNPSTLGTVIAKPYFRILERAHREVGGASMGLPLIGSSSVDVQGDDVGPDDVQGHSDGNRTATGRSRARTGSRAVEGYYERFFVEEKKLGMGAEGTVYLCQHVLDDIPLGHYAIKKVAIGESRAYLHKTLKEVRLLESLRHENIVGYHHVWIEETRFGSIGSPVAALHMLMMYANAGNLDAYISHRRSSSHHHHRNHLDPISGTDNDAPTPISRDNNDNDRDLDSSSGPLPTAEQLKRAFRQRRASVRPGTGTDRIGEQRGVMLLSREELGSLFGDVVAGLAFLHSNAILHLDLKCSNVLLHRRDDMSVPTAMISDFGTSQEMIQSKRERTGATGTMEYTAPESIFPDHLGRFREMDSKVDMWALGLILHKLLFFRLPYGRSDSFDDLGRQISAYKGYKATTADKELCRARALPVGLLTLLEGLVNVRPDRRPTADKVQERLRLIDLSAKQRDGDGHELEEALQLLPLSQVVLGSRAERPHGRGTDIVITSKPDDAVTLPAKTGSAAGIRRLHALVALCKIVSIYPPVQRANPSNAVLATTVCLASLDVLAEDRAGWAALMVCHLAILAWTSWGAGAAGREI